MGLDICVNRPVMLGNRNPNEVEDFYILDDNPELSVFKDFIFERENEYYDLKTAAKNAGHDLSELTWSSISYGEDACEIAYIFNDKNGNEIKLTDVPKITKLQKCIAYEEIGHQRKGVNKRFYDDGVWGGPCITDNNTLIDHWVKYFSGNTPESVGGCGSSVEHDLIDKEMKTQFKSNIVDKFIEGETFVVYC